MHVGFGERRGETCIILDTRRPAPILQVVRSEADLDAGLDEAMEQIHDRKYYIGMSGKVILFAMSFWNKIPKVRSEIVVV